jgi:hypothetical protein
MMQIVAAVVIALFAGATFAQAPAAPAAPAAPIVTPVYKKAPPTPKHKKALVRKERSKKAASF